MFGCCKLAQVKFRNADGTLDIERYREALRDYHSQPGRTGFFQVEPERACTCECHYDGSVCLC